MDILCLVIWVLSLIDAVAQTIKKEPVRPVSAICAIVVCIIYYLGNVLGVT